MHSAFYYALAFVALIIVVNLFYKIISFVWRVDDYFRHFVADALRQYQQYFIDIMQHHIAQQNKMENVWLKWPFRLSHAEFDQKLRPGYHFFLQKLNQIGDVLFSLHYLSTQFKDNAYLQPLSDHLHACEKLYLDHFERLIQTVELFHELIELPDIKTALISLEKKFRELFPYSIETLDIHHDAIVSANFICSLEDLHWLLGKLSESLQKR